MKKEDQTKAYFTSHFWSVLSSVELRDFEGSLGEEQVFGPDVTLSAKIEFDGTHLARLARRKRDYLEAAKQQPVSDEKVINELAKDVANALDIIFNKIGFNMPEEGIYEKQNNDQWRKTDISDYYVEYQDLLWELVSENNGNSIPSLYREFLFTVSETDDYDLPPEGVVEDILKLHLKNIRTENQSRAAVSKLKQELESSGMYPREAASKAKHLEKYLKTDSQLIEEGLLDDEE